MSLGDEAGFLKLKGLGVEEVNQGHDEGCRLTDNGCVGRTCHAHLKYEDKNGVENDVNDCTRQHGEHCPKGASVRTDNRVHHVTENEYGNHGKNDVQILDCVCHGIL